MDDAVDAIIAAAPGDETVSVVHRLHQVDHKIFKEYRRLRHDLRQQFICQLPVDGIVYPIEGFSRRFLRVNLCDRLRLSPFRMAYEFREGRKMFCQQSVCDLNAALQQLLSLICDGKIPSFLKRFDAACLFEICPCPTHAIVKNRLPAAGKALGAFLLGKAEFVRDASFYLFQRMHVSIHKGREKRRVQLVVFRQSHGLSPPGACVRRPMRPEVYTYCITALQKMP